MQEVSDILTYRYKATATTPAHTTAIHDAESLLHHV
jgi:hypothetical protein